MSGVRSMTGFAEAAGSLSEGTAFTVSLKSVNHRFLDLHFRLPGGCDALEMELRGLIKRSVERGHVEVTLELGRAAQAGSRVNEEALAALLQSLRAVAKRAGLAQEPELGALLRVPGVLMTEARASRTMDDSAMEVVLAATRSALEQLNGVREQEGATLAEELRAGMGRLGVASETLNGLRAGVRLAVYERLRGKLQELLAGAAVSEDRLLTEAGLLAEKSDVEEELVRLRTHRGQFLAILDEGGAVGKRLDFLLQELSREANTALAKTGSAAGPDGLRITELGLAMKSEIERAREQVQNLE